MGKVGLDTDELEERKLEDVLERGVRSYYLYPYRTN